MTSAIAELAAGAGIRRVQAIGWRDLEDPTAGGSEIHINAILERWADAGIDVVLRTGAVERQPAEVDRHGVRVVRRGGHLGVWPRAIGATALHRDGPFDALVEVWHGVSFFSPLWSRRPTIGIFHHVHTDQFRQVLPPGLAQVAQWLERRVYPRMYAGRPLIALSPSVEQQMIDELGWDPSGITVVSPGVDDRFVPGERSDTPLVVTVARLMPQKGVADVVAVAGRVHQSHPEVRFVVVGTGPENDRLEQQIRSAGLTGVVELVGAVDDQRLLQLYQQAWVLLSASRKEGWGMTVTEAGACGTPAVVTDIPGHREAVVDGVSGLLAPDVGGLAHGIVTLVEDTARRTALGLGARDHAAAHTWDACATDTFRVLAREASRSPR